MLLTNAILSMDGKHSNVEVAIMQCLVSAHISIAHSLLPALFTIIFVTRKFAESQGIIYNGRNTFGSRSFDFVKRG